MLTIYILDLKNQVKAVYEFSLLAQYNIQLFETQWPTFCLLHTKIFFLLSTKQKLTWLSEILIFGFENCDIDIQLFTTVSIFIEKTGRFS